MTERRYLTWSEKEALRDRMGFAERGGEVFALLAIVLVALFFYEHQARSTGFFTSSFGPTESLFLYGSILSGMAGPLSRLVTGRRNISRLPEMIAAAFWILGSVWLLVYFPFNFAHLADVLPEFLRFALAWITNDIARIFFILGLLGGIASVSVNAILYLRVRSLLRQTQRVK
jgi:hypothetical protein